MARLTPQAREELVKQRRGQLLDAALQLMARQGFAATSMEDIAREAGVAKGTVYLYFPTKDALLTALLETQSLLPELTALLGALPIDADVETIVRHVVPALWSALATRTEAVALLLRESGTRASSDTRYLERMLPVSEALAARLAQQIGSEQAQRLDTFVAVRAALWMLLGLFVEQQILGGREVRPLDDRAVTDTISEMFLRGVLGTSRA